MGLSLVMSVVLAAAVLDVRLDYRVVVAESPPAAGTLAPETAAPCAHRLMKHETMPAQRTSPQARMLRLRQTHSPRSTIPGGAAQLPGLHNTMLSAQRSHKHFVPYSWHCSSAAIKQPAMTSPHHSTGKQLLSITPLQRSPPCSLPSGTWWASALGPVDGTQSSFKMLKPLARSSGQVPSCSEKPGWCGSWLASA